VLVELCISGISHSQLHQIHNPDLLRPLLLGREATGVVAATGSAVTHVKEGDRVMVTWVPRDITVVDPAVPRTCFNFRGRKVAGPDIYT
jgi:Zn-dependent alcohol dehydrogenase